MQISGTIIIFAIKFLDCTVLSYMYYPKKAYVCGTGWRRFGILGIIVDALKTNVSLIGPFSFGTESIGNGLSLEP